MTDGTGRPVQPARLPQPTTADERAFHRQALDDIQPNADTKDELIFPQNWVQMWLRFDRRLMDDVDQLTAERDALRRQVTRYEETLRDIRKRVWREIGGEGFAYWSMNGMERARDLVYGYLIHDTLDPLLREMDTAAALGQTAEVGAPLPPAPPHTNDTDPATRVDDDSRWMG